LGTAEVFQEVEAIEAPDMSFIDAADQPQDQHAPSEPNSPAPMASSLAGSRGSTPRQGTTKQPDPALERQKYIGKLKALLTQKEKVREDEMRQEDEQMTLMLPGDRINAGRETKVMARWQERQRDWERLQHRIAQKMGKDPAKMMMAGNNEFRERLEEYQTVLAAVPLHERNIGAMWEMSLREGGSRLVPIGNIFSGLFCPLRADVPLPKVVRRPQLPGQPSSLPPSSSQNFKTWRDDHAILEKKRHLRRHLAELRPHEISRDLSQGLVVVGQDLLQWAHDTSRDHFAANDRKLDAGPSASLVDDEERGEDGSIAARPLLGGSTPGGASAVGTKEDLGEMRGPRIHLGPSPYLLLEAGVKEPVEGALSLHNQGSSTLFYEWMRLEEEIPSLVAISKSRTAEGSVPSDPSARFAISNDAAESRFLCQNASGVLMPGESKATVFAFESSTPGSFSETWKLKVTPPAAVLGDLIPSADGLVAVSLLGAAMTIDTNEHRRMQIRQELEKNVTRADLRQLVTEVVRDVRTPVREDAVRYKEKVRFETTNVGVGLNYTPPIFDALSSLWGKVNEMVPQGAEGDNAEPLPPWDADVNSIRRVIDGIVDPNEVIAAAESALSQVEELTHDGDEEGSEERSEESDDEEEEAEEDGEEPAPLEEFVFREEEDDEDEDETVEVEEVLSAIQQARKEVDLEWKLLVARSSARPLPSLSGLLVEQVVKSLADVVVDAVENARSELDIPDNEVFVPLPTPFPPFHLPVDSDGNGGAEVWSTVLETPLGASDPADKRGLEMRYRALSYNKARSGLCELVDGFTSRAQLVHRDALKHFAQKSISAHGSASKVDIRTASVLRVAEDCASKRVLVLADLDVGEDMISDPFNNDLFGIPEGPRLPKVVAVSKLVRKLLKEKGPEGTVIITTELTSPPAEAGDERHPVPPLAELSVASLEPMLSVQLKVPVLFCPSVASLEEAMSREEIPEVILLDHVDAETMVPLLEPDEVVDSDEEDDRLPWLGDEKDDPAFKPPPDPVRLDLGKALKPSVDVFVCDNPDACVDERRSLSGLTAPEVLRVAGPSLRRELVSASVLLDRPKRPMAAIVAGEDLLEEVKHIDRMIDVVDELIIAGRIGLVFLAALGHKTGALKPDPAHLPMARALLAKAQVLGVPVTLPVDYVMGDVFVDELGNGSGPVVPIGEELDDANDEDADPDEGPVDESAGFDYDGEVRPNTCLIVVLLV
jgi:3-phosphoglycerate kinase